MTKRRTDRPGYQRRARADGTFAHYWNPNRACSAAPASLPLRPIDDAAADETIAELCRRWTDELLADLDNIRKTPDFDGTISSLIRIYRTNDQSPYQALKHSTRIRDYEPSLSLIDRTVGKRAIGTLIGDDFRRWYERGRRTAS